MKRVVFLTAILAALASAAPMHFTQAGSYIVAQGDITEETPAEFKQLGISPGAALYFDSPGGNLLAGLELGRLIRRSGLHTYVAPTGNGCYSTCVYAFAGGAVRTYDGRPPLGVHQFRDGNSESSAQTALAIVAEYLDEMGIDHRLLEAASLVPPEDVQTIPVKVAREWKLDNSKASTAFNVNPADASDIFDLHSECKVLGETLRSSEEARIARKFGSGNSLRARQTSYYDPQAHRCYVRLETFDASDLTHSLITLYDGRSKEQLAAAIPPVRPLASLTVGAPTAPSEFGMIGFRYEGGHAAYLKAKAFIDEHMREK